VDPAPGGGSLVELRVRSESGAAVPRFLERRVTERSARESVDALAAAVARAQLAALR
jgi:hypothetical protein